MPRKRKSNLSQSSNKARTMKIARFNETFPQAKLRRLEHLERETPEQSQVNYMASQRATETVEDRLI
ncbi:unnamed protein product [Macrosiphum euphorbiae]|uniref:Uncharacterized protein n=1 Tax=Macrosiphum euphorbiae TaxID=13131 RepID=A0AAV0X4V0_9HEMI|nr:unnamed protein product [Macrosiphum euphorbiae]